MKRAVVSAVVVCAGILEAQASMAVHGAEIVRETALGPISRGGRYLATVCPSGMSFVHSGFGGIVVVGAQGSILTTLSSVEGLEDATASMCDSRNRLFVAGKGFVRVFDVSPIGQVTRSHSFYVSGIARRMTVVGDVLYILGYAKVSGKPTLLRRYSLPDGRLLSTMEPRVPVHAGAGNNAINSFATEGSLSVYPASSGVLYVPANPLEFTTFDASGQQVRAIRPAVPHFANVDPSARLGAPDWKSVDWAVNTVIAPDGRIVVHVVKRGDLPGAPVGVPYSHLKLFSPDFEIIADNIQVGSDRFPGLMIGSDRDGNLYFARLSVPGGGAILKVRLTSP
jgi:hypothetical protein